MSKTCARCQKVVYPTEELVCLDKVWHKTCFKCTECGMTLNMRNYKGFDKLPYCGVHVPKAKATAITDSPELKRLAENTRIQSNVMYHAAFERSRGKLIQVAVDKEIQRVKQNTKIISNAAYHGDLEKKAAMDRQREFSECSESPEELKESSKQTSQWLEESQQRLQSGQQPVEQQTSPLQNITAAPKTYNLWTSASVQSSDQPTDSVLLNPQWTAPAQSAHQQEERSGTSCVSQLYPSADIQESGQQQSQWLEGSQQCLQSEHQPVDQQTSPLQNTTAAPKTCNQWCSGTPQNSDQPSDSVQLNPQQVLQNELCGTSCIQNNGQQQSPSLQGSQQHFQSGHQPLEQQLSHFHNTAAVTNTYNQCCMSSDQSTDSLLLNPQQAAPAQLSHQQVSQNELRGTSCVSALVDYFLRSQQRLQPFRNTEGGTNTYHNQGCSAILQNLDQPTDSDLLNPHQAAPDQSPHNQVSQNEVCGTNCVSQLYPIADIQNNAQQQSPSLQESQQHVQSGHQLLEQTPSKFRNTTTIANTYNQCCLNSDQPTDSVLLNPQQAAPVQLLHQQVSQKERRGTSCVSKLVDYFVRSQQCLESGHQPFEQQPFQNTSGTTNAYNKRCSAIIQNSDQCPDRLLLNPQQAGLARLPHNQVMQNELFGANCVSQLYPIADIQNKGQQQSPLLLGSQQYLQYGHPPLEQQPSQFQNTTAVTNTYNQCCLSSDQPSDIVMLKTQQAASTQSPHEQVTQKELYDTSGVSQLVDNLLHSQNPANNNNSQYEGRQQCEQLGHQPFEQQRSSFQNTPAAINTYNRGCSSISQNVDQPTDIALLNPQQPAPAQFPHQQISQNDLCGTSCVSKLVDYFVRSQQCVQSGHQPFEQQPFLNTPWTTNTYNQGCSAILMNSNQSTNSILLNPQQAGLSQSPYKQVSQNEICGTNCGSQLYPIASIQNSGQQLSLQGSQQHPQTEHQPLEQQPSQFDNTALITNTYNQCCLSSNQAADSVLLNPQLAYQQVSQKELCGTSCVSEQMDYFVRSQQSLQSEHQPFQNTPCTMSTCNQGCSAILHNSAQPTDNVLINPHQAVPAQSPHVPISQNELCGTSCLPHLNPTDSIQNNGQQHQQSGNQQFEEQPSQFQNTATITNTYNQFCLSSDHPTDSLLLNSQQAAPALSPQQQCSQKELCGTNCVSEQMDNFVCSQHSLQSGYQPFQITPCTINPYDQGCSAILQNSDQPTDSVLLNPQQAVPAQSPHKQVSQSELCGNSCISQLHPTDSNRNHGQQQSPSLQGSEQHQQSGLQLLEQQPSQVQNTAVVSNTYHQCWSDQPTDSLLLNPQKAAPAQSPHEQVSQGGTSSVYEQVDNLIDPKNPAKNSDLPYQPQSDSQYDVQEQELLINTSKSTNRNSSSSTSFVSALDTLPTDHNDVDNEVPLGTTGEVVDNDPMTDESCSEPQDSRGSADDGDIDPANDDIDAVDSTCGSVVQENDGTATQNPNDMNPLPEGEQEQVEEEQELPQPTPSKTQTPRIYRALYKYKARDFDEVSFREGDLIHEIDPINYGWLTGRVERTGKCGMLPANYVAEVFK